MPTDLVPRRISDDVFEYAVESSSAAQSLVAQLRSLSVAEDVVAGLKTVCIHFDPLNLVSVEAALAKIDRVEPMPLADMSIVELSMRYGDEYGPDLSTICEATGLSVSAFIDLHSQLIHKVEMIGFTPGFAYMSGLPDTFAVPRLSTPRSHVAAGAVGISSDYTGVYALAGPGGWPLIGRVEDQLFEPESSTPFRLHPGQQVRFKAVS
ncbi:MAG: carboxyltransferase domain-containing protein [Pseudomonadota bacterium]